MVKDKAGSGTQKTPKGLEIPVPSRKLIFEAFKKITKPKK